MRWRRSWPSGVHPPPDKPRAIAGRARAECRQRPDGSPANSPAPLYVGPASRIACQEVRRAWRRCSAFAAFLIGFEGCPEGTRASSEPSAAILAPGGFGAVCGSWAGGEVASTRKRSLSASIAGASRPACRRFIAPLLQYGTRNVSRWSGSPMCASDRPCSRSCRRGAEQPLAEIAAPSMVRRPAPNAVAFDYR